MKHTITLTLAFLTSILSSCDSGKKATTEKTMEKITYPTVARVNQVDDYFGTKVEDPYRWLEVSDSSAVEKWVKEQNKVTFDYLAKIPFRDKIKQRLEKVWNYERIGVPMKFKDFYIYTKNNGLQNQSVYYITKDLKQVGDVLLDPNKLSKDGTASITTGSVSHDGKYFAYALAQGGSDWNTISVIDIATKKTLDDQIEWVKFSPIAWYKDGFFYGRYDSPKKGKELESKNEYQKIYYHQIGKKQADDVLIYEEKQNPLHIFSAETSKDEKYLFVSISKGTHGNAVIFKDLSKNTPFKPLVEGFEYDNAPIGNIGEKIFLYTNDKAPKYKLVGIDANKVAPTAWQNIIPETENVLTSVSYVGKKLIAAHMKDASHKVSVLDTEGKKLHDVALPTLGTVGGFGGDEDATETFYVFTSFTYPSTVYRHDLASNASTVYFKPNIDFKSEDYTTKEVFYPSKDGTKVHMFITHKKDLKLDGKNPTYLYAYGGFNISLTPSFDVKLIPFLENGGVYAMPNLRGGGEYGEDWHKGGMELKKQNVFDDFIAAADYLVQQKYTSSEKLAISGRSNGGLLVGAVMTQRPDLAKVALPGVGVMDMLRYHKFTIGWAWVGEYGSSDSVKHFKNLYSYSPLHNIKKGMNYPATLAFTADHDDRVVPAHSYKFISNLQANHAGDNPVLIRIDEKAGHGAGKPTAKQIEEWADIWAFVLYNVGVDYK